VRRQQRTPASLLTHLRHPVPAQRRGYLHAAKGARPPQPDDGAELPGPGRRGHASGAPQGKPGRPMETVVSGVENEVRYILLLAWKRHPANFLQPR
jgi:hypothetical protein